MSRVKHVMIDLETLSTKPNALVLAIGACEINFQLNDVGHKFYTSIDHKSYEGSKPDIDADTVMWWMRQSDDARTAIQHKDNSLGIHDALLTLTNWMCDFNHIVSGADELHVWGNGADFDNVILSHWLREFSITQPWSFRGNRCFRTVKNLFPDTPDPASDNAIKHHALHDAEWQANKLILINNRHNLGL